MKGKGKKMTNLPASCQQLYSLQPTKGAIAARHRPRREGSWVCGNLWGDEWLLFGLVSESENDIYIVYIIYSICVNV